MTVAGVRADRAGRGTPALAQLASAGYPVLAQTARPAGGVPPEEEFGPGLAIVLRGFRAMLAEPSPPTREQP